VWQIVRLEILSKWQIHHNKDWNLWKQY
jgi:hypothetical protein